MADQPTATATYAAVATATPSPASTPTLTPQTLPPESSPDTSPPDPNLDGVDGSALPPTSLPEIGMGSKHGDGWIRTWLMMIVAALIAGGVSLVVYGGLQIQWNSARE